MSLIDKTYFRLDINIDDSSNYSDLQLYIDRFEPVILKKVFGYELAKQIAAYDSEASIDPIKSLVEGAEYTDEDGYLQKWDGLVNLDKRSLIAYYVYYKYRRATATYTTKAGEKRAATENAIDAETGQKIMAAWKYVENQIQVVTDYIATIPELSVIFRPSEIGSVNAFDL
jgi:hypothetical protein